MSNHEKDLSASLVNLARMYLNGEELILVVAETADVEQDVDVITVN